MLIWYPKKNVDFQLNEEVICQNVKLALILRKRVHECGEFQIQMVHRFHSTMDGGGVPRRKTIFGPREE
jgi:hypothetical protein